VQQLSAEHAAATAETQRKHEAEVEKLRDSVERARRRRRCGTSGNAARRKIA